MNKKLFMQYSHDFYLLLQSSKDPSEPDIKKRKKDREEREAREKEKERDRAKKDKERRERDEKESQRQRDKAERERKEKEAKEKAESEVVMLSDEEVAEDKEMSSQMDTEDFALEMGIACVICK